MTTATPPRFWTNVASEHNSTEAQREHIASIVDRIEWHSPDEEGTIPACQGFAIKALREEYSRGSFLAYCWSNELAPYGLVGIELGFSNSRQRIYAIDLGSKLSVLVADTIPNAA